jgi:benzodiazapine receptor
MLLSVVLQTFLFFLVFLLAAAVGLAGQPFTARVTRRSNRSGCGGRPTRPVLEGEPQTWYDRLPLAPWQPPAFVFGLVWPLLYAALTVSVWLVLRDDRSADDELWSWGVGLWLAQLVLNALWTPLFYGAGRISAGLVILLVKVFVAAAVAWCFYGQSIAAFVLQLVYGAWILFATSLNAYSVCAE